MKFNSKKFTKALKAARNGQNRTKLSIDIEVDRTALVRYENGSTPGTIHFARICKYLKQPMESFFTTTK